MEEAAPSQQHVVAVPFPAQGHLNPLMRFCKLLANQHGLIVTFVDFGPLHDRLQQLQSSADAIAPAHRLPTHPAPLVRRARIPFQAFDLSNGFNVSFRNLYDSLSSIAPHLEQLIVSLTPPVTCVLSDFNITFPTQDVADKLGIPRVVLYPCFATRLLLTHYLTKGEVTSIEAVEKALALNEDPSNIFCKLPGLPTLFNKDIPHFNHLTDETIPLWRTTLRAWQVCSERAHAVVVNSFRALEPSTFATLSESCDVPIYDAGLWIETLQNDTITSLWKEDNACISWLDQQPTSSVLYLSLGSITLLSQAQYEEFLHGLLASQHRFLWVLRPGLVPDMDYPSAVDYINSNSNGKGLVINWAPQLQVLAHPSVGGFLTHCGWNSTSEAIAHGVPMLCWPYFADQPLNAHCIADEWKVGLRMISSNKETRLIERVEIEKAIRDLMEGTEADLFRENAAKLKESSKQCFLDNGSSHSNLKFLVKSLQDRRSSRDHFNIHHY